MMKHLFKNWFNVLAVLTQAEQILLLLDYDGTLTPIVATPEQAVLADEVRQLLESLAKKERFKLGIISGRKLTEIQGIIGIAGIYYAGNHGLEMTGPDLHYIHPQGSQARPYLAHIFQSLNEGLSQIEGVILEDKGYSLSLHYRLVEKGCLPKVRQVFDQVCQPYVSQKQVKVTQGKMVLEVRPPVDWDKGKAVLALQDLMGKVAAQLTIYMGDDQTDEDAFLVLKTGADMSVLVGNANQPSQAKYFLKDVGEVMEFLTMLKELP